MINNEDSELILASSSHNAQTIEEFRKKAMKEMGSTH
jgi:hypothetical protein